MQNYIANCILRSTILLTPERITHCLHSFMFIFSVTVFLSSLRWPEKIAWSCSWVHSITLSNPQTTLYPFYACYFFPYFINSPSLSVSKTLLTAICSSHFVEFRLYPAVRISFLSYILPSVTPRRRCLSCFGFCKSSNWSILFKFLAFRVFCDCDGYKYSILHLRRWPPTIGFIEAPNCFTPFSSIQSTLEKTDSMRLAATNYSDEQLVSSSNVTFQ